MMQNIQFKKKVALVTGANGFSGSHLLSTLLLNGWCVHAIVRDITKIPTWQDFPGVFWHKYENNINNLIDIIQCSHPDIVFHLASLFVSHHTAQDVMELINSNILFGAQLLEAMRLCNVDKIINTGSSWQHYNNLENNAVNLYAATKQAFEDIIAFYVNAHNFKVITLKLFDTYGPFDQRQKLLKLLLDATASGKEIAMSLGEQLIDIVYITDVIQAYIIAAARIFELQEHAHEVYAVSSQNLLSLRQIVNICEDVTRIKINIKWGARAYRYREVMLPWSCGLQLPNWSPKVKFEDGIKLMWGKL